MNLIRGGSGSRRVVGRGKEGSYIHMSWLQSALSPVTLSLCKDFHGVKSDCGCREGELRLSCLERNGRGLGCGLRGVKVWG